MATAPLAYDVHVVEVSEADGREALRLQVADRLGIALPDFLERLAAGEYDDCDDDNVLRLVMLAPFAAA